MSIGAGRVTVRAAGTEDLGAIAGIFAHYVVDSVATFEETPPTVPQWREKLADLTERDLPFLAAEVSGQVVGYAYATPWRPKPAYRHTVEDSVYLEPGWTGRGIGRLLLNELVTGSTRAGARQMIAVIADSGDTASVRLHRACGFTEAGRLTMVGFKHGRWLDTVLLERGLNGGARLPR
jgi:phosphinothricin acetyltransferase